MTRPHLLTPRRVLASGLALAAAATLTLTASGTAAQAAAAPKSKITPYAFSATGFGTIVNASDVRLRSARTAYSLIGCTKRSGLNNTNNIAAADLNGQVRVGAVTTAQTTGITAAGTTYVRSTTTIASINLGSDEAGIQIRGLRGVSTAYAGKSGKLNANSTFTFTDLGPIGGQELPEPLNHPADIILQELAKSGPITIPGFGVIKLGQVAKAVGRDIARSGSIGLEFRMFGADQTSGTADDSNVLIGRSYARITRSATYGVFSGGSWGLDASLLDGSVVLGRNAFIPLQCEGTRGRVRTDAVAGLNLGGADQLIVSGVREQVYGLQDARKRGGRGWSRSTIAAVDLGGGQLKISAIDAYARVFRSSSNRLYRAHVQTIGSMTVNGEEHAIPDPGQAIEIPGLARIEVPKPVITKYGIDVTGLRITLLGGSAANTVVNLANTSVAVRRY